MSENLYKWYVEIIRRINKLKECDGESNELRETIHELEETLSTLEVSCPDLKPTYDRRTAIQKSFTYEQRDFICYQIGEWYLEWKSRIIVDSESGTHRLGYAKEMLKELICGD